MDEAVKALCTEHAVSLVRISTFLTQFARNVCGLIRKKPEELLYIIYFVFLFFNFFSYFCLYRFISFISVILLIVLLF